MSINKTFEISIGIIQREYPEDFKTLDWNSISSFKLLSNQFIIKYAAFLNWNVLCTHQKLNDYILKKFAFKLKYKTISITQLNNMSIEYIFEHRSVLDMKYILNKGKFTQNQISSLYNKYYEYFNTIYNKTKIIDDDLIRLSNKLFLKENKQSETVECFF